MGSTEGPGKEVESLFASAVFNKSPLLKEGVISVAHVEQKPHQGTSSRRAKGGSGGGPSRSSGSKEIVHKGHEQSIVLKGNEQSTSDKQTQYEAFNKGQRELRVNDSLGCSCVASASPDRSSQGKRRAEGSMDDDGDGRSFWVSSLPQDTTLIELRDLAERKTAVEAKKSEDSPSRGGLWWGNGQEHMDLAQGEKDTTASSLDRPLHAQTEVNDWLKEIPKGLSSDPALARARRRNAIRLRKANESDLGIVSKYLPSDASVFFPFEIEGPDDYYEVRAGWLDSLIKVAGAKCSTPRAPQVKFGTTPQDLSDNLAYLENCDWDFEEVFARHRGTTVDHGSEFRPVADLAVFLGKHPYFSELSRMFENGFEYHLSKELSEVERREELQAQLDRGNHKSATENETEVGMLLESDVRHGFVFPVWEEAIPKVKGSMLQPGGMVRQLSLKADGSRKVKNRFTHDLSFAITSENASINARIDMSRYTDMVYGWCFQRILHYLAALRSAHPSTRIYLSKFDYSDAYKRISQSPQATAATVVRFGRVAYFCWRMVFGGSPNPAGFSCFSETLTDLANEIAMSKYHPSMGSSDTVLQSHLIPKEVESDDAVIEPAVRPALLVSARVTSYRDCFIDDVIDCHLGTQENLERAPHLVQLAVQAMSRPHAGDDIEPVPRRPLLGPEKLEAEGRSSERQIILGWEVQTRAFVVSLPFDKHRAWREDLDQLIDKEEVTQQEMESMIGRLNHASFLIPLSRHFLNEVRTKCMSAPRRKGQHLRLSGDESKDMALWRTFLDIAKQGISINLLVLRTPTKIAWSDSCPFGLGGYTLRGGAWRIKVPVGCPFYGHDSVNNVLEFLGMAISVLLLLREAAEDGEKFPCLLVLGDNTSAISWIFRSGRIPRSSRYYPIVKEIARRIALDVTQGGAQLCSQHIAGKMNVISDLLSFEGDCRQETNPLTKDRPPNDVLTARILKYHSQIVPSGFEIRRLPPEIESFAFSVMQTTARSWSQDKSRQMSETIVIGEDGSSSSGIGDWEKTPSSIRYPETKSESCWQRDLSCHVEPTTSTSRAELLQSVRNQWYRRLFEMPLAAWHRRSGNVDGQAPSTSRTESMVKDRFTLK